jgi:hypothetical protein
MNLFAAAIGQLAVVEVILQVHFGLSYRIFSCEFSPNLTSAELFQVKWPFDEQCRRRLARRVDTKKSQPCRLAFTIDGTRIGEAYAVCRVRLAVGIKRRYCPPLAHSTR